jgi:glycosyltransferase involved in cell wall biosynthesis
MAGCWPVKIAMVTDCYPPRLGGIESQVRDLSRSLVAGGHDVEVFTATAGPDGERGGAVSTGPDGVTVHRFAIRLPGGVPVNPCAPREIRRRIAAGRFDVAHAHLGIVSPFATELVPVALGLGMPVTATFHCVFDRAAPLFRAIGHVARWAAAGVALNAVSTMAAARVSAVARDAQVDVVPNGIDAAWWRASPADGPSADAPSADAPTPPPGVRHRPVHVVSAMRLVSRKRPLATLDVLGRARDLLDPAIPLTATIVGEGPQRRRMEGHLRSMDMAWVSLPGRVDREDLRRLHHGADAYLTAAHLEAFGIAALEARAAGVPVLAVRGTGADDFVTDGVDGLLADSDDMLARQLARLASDDELREGIRAHLQTTPPSQDWPGVVGATFAQYVRAGAC